MVSFVRNKCRNRKLHNVVKRRRDFLRERGRRRASLEYPLVDWQTAFGGVLAAIGGAAGAVYLGFRRIRRDFATDGAERFADHWFQKVIQRQDQEAARLREEIAILRENGTQTTKRLLEVELRERVKEKIIRDLIKDIRLVKRDEMPLEALNTGLVDDL